MPEGQEKFIPMKDAGIRDWENMAYDSGLVSEQKLKELIIENEQKQKRLRAFNLPTFATYGPTNSFTETAELIPQEKKTSASERFLVRCAPKNLMSNTKIERTLNITWSEVEKFVEQLPEGKDNYTVEIREHWNADYGGAIVGDGNGHVILELVKGNLTNIDKKGLGEIKKGELNIERADIHFKYDGQPTDAEKQVMIGALKYFIPDLDREKLEQLNLYAEYAYSKDHGYRFFEATTEKAAAKFWTELGYTRTPKEETTGD